MASKKSSSTRSRSRSTGGRKKATTRAGKYVKKEIHHKRSGKHPVKNRKQAIAIGLSKARRKGVKVPRKSSAYSRRKGSSSSRRRGSTRSSSRKSSR